MNADCALIVFAKAPVPGFAKTRLAPVLGDAAAARLAARMLNETVACAVAANVGLVELCCAPDDSHQEFQRLAAHHGIALTVQGEGDLGARMQRAFTRVLARDPRALLIGTDAPGLDPIALRQAAQALRSHAAVLAPASDGGYVLMGLSRPLPPLFSGIAWSTSEVMAQTRARLAQLDVDAAELAVFHDVDEPEDLVHVPPEWLR